MAFSDKSKELRGEKKITQAQLAQAINLSRSCISMIEIGKNEPTATTLIAYAKYFGVSADYLLGLEDDFGVKEAEKSLRAYDQHELTDRQQVDLLKMYKLLTEIQKAQVFGYVLALLEEAGVDVKSVLGP